MSAVRVIKKVRGLSLLQKRIMAIAAQGYVTPWDAVECALRTLDYSDTWGNISSASASRALRRLVQRGLLVPERRKFKHQSPVYRRVGWAGEIPYIASSHTVGATERHRCGERSNVLRLLEQFDDNLAEQQKRLDTSLTKAEREIGERLNMFLTEGEQELLRQAETEIATAAGIPLPEDLSVEDGRKVLVGILERRRLTGNKELEAAR